jgi:superfamily I DNA/RNA helicase
MIASSPYEVSFDAPDVMVYLAAAGAGKTTALMRELALMLREYRPDEIAFVTFTRKGVANARERALSENPGLTAEALVYVRTLHALCFRELELKYTQILTREHVARFNRLLGFNISFAPLYDTQNEDDRLLARYDAVRNGATVEYLQRDDYSEERYLRLINAYEHYKETWGLVDFHDCLLRFKERGQPVHVKAAFIDEAQDLTQLQWEVCRIAFSECERIRIGGDDYQSIFQYLGASPHPLIALAQKHPTVKLEKSYRLPKRVYDLSRVLTDGLREKIEKDYVPVKSEEGFVQFRKDRYTMAQTIALDIAKHGASPYRWFFLFRNNCFIDELIPHLEEARVPYHTAGGFVIPKAELSRIARYRRYQSGGGDPAARDAFCLKYGIKDLRRPFTESRLIPSERRFVYAQYVGKYGVDALVTMEAAEPAVFLSTPHKVKGGEADYVVVCMDCTQKVQDNAVNNPDEELRVLYVACTRARHGLYLLHSESNERLDSILSLMMMRMGGIAE